MPTASVTMNGGSLALVMMIPFTKPKAVATAMHARMATTRGTAGVPSAFTMRCRRISTAPAVARTGPLDRSIPPAMITNVMPRAIAPTVDVFRSMLSRLSEQQEAGRGQSADADDDDEHDQDAVVAPDVLCEIEDPRIRLSFQDRHVYPSPARTSVA